METIKLSVGTLIVFLTLSGLMLSCGSSKEDLWKSSMAARQNGEPQKAIHHLQKYLAKTNGSAEQYQAHRALAELHQYDTNDFRKALDHYRKALTHSSETADRILIQTRIADTLFEKVNDYAQAIVEYSLLNQIDPAPKKAATYKLRIAMAHYHQGNLPQAFEEATQILAEVKDENAGFEAKLLQANIQLAQKEVSKAAGTYEELIASYPQRSATEKIGLNLAMCYEELNDFEKAIKALERMKADYPNPEYLQIRIDRLERRQKTRPGARGLKR